MKTAFVLLLAAGLGALPFGLLSLQAFLGFYTVAGVLAFAVRDYGRTATRGRQPRRRAASPEAGADALSDGLARTWGYQTVLT